MKQSLGKRFPLSRAPLFGSCLGLLLCSLSFMALFWVAANSGEQAGTVSKGDMNDESINTYGILLCTAEIVDFKLQRGKSTSEH